MSLPWRMASACGRRQSHPRAWLGISPEAGPAGRMQEDISSLEMSPKLSWHLETCRVLAQAQLLYCIRVSWAKAMSAAGLFMQTEMTCWRNTNGLFCTLEKNFNITPFFFFSGKCKQFAPRSQELDFVVSRISSVSV